MKLRALIVDDSRVMRVMVMHTLKRTNLAEFEFTEAVDGADALAKFDPAATDIVFVDWHMPQMSGIEFVQLARSRQNTEQIPIVMVTGESATEKIDQAIQSAGATAYITKPFLPDQIAALLNKLLPTMDPVAG